MTTCCQKCRSSQEHGGFNDNVSIDTRNGKGLFLQNEVMDDQLIVLATTDTLILYPQTFASSRPSHFPLKGSNQNVQSSLPAHPRSLQHNLRCSRGISSQNSGNECQPFFGLQLTQLWHLGGQNHRNDHKILQAAKQKHTKI